jgi:SAM-dependent methyltransferase
MTAFAAAYAGEYDTLYETKAYGQECDLIESALGRFGQPPSGSVLDIGCGTGGHAIELARRGYAMHGVDLSQDMLTIAEGKAEALPDAQRPRWTCADARTFDVGGTFDAAIMMFAVVGYLTANDDVLAGLKNIRRHLNSGALFMSDFWYGPSVLSDRPTDRVKVIDTATGQIIRATSTTLDIPNHTADVSFKLWTSEGGRLSSQTEELHRMRYFFPQEYALFLSQAGFEMVSLSAFPSLDEPLNDSRWNAFVVAKAK